MGISTIQSYHGAQVFEAIGLNQDFVDEYFTWTPSRIGGGGIGGYLGEVATRAGRGGFRSRPKTQRPVGPTFLESERDGTTNKPGAKNGDRAQGTRKILLVYGHFTSVPGGKPRTST